MHDAARPRVYVHMGQVQVGRAPAVLTTLLGTCVSICLYHPDARAGGLNHFALPGWGPGGPTAPARYAEPAWRALFARVLALGVGIEGLVAKVYGGMSGARVAALGRDNALDALRILDEAGIPVVHCDVGGRSPRRLCFDLATGAVDLQAFGAFP